MMLRLIAPSATFFNIAQPTKNITKGFLKLEKKPTCKPYSLFVSQYVLTILFLLAIARKNSEGKVSNKC